VQASAVVPNANPVTFVINFNGGTLQAVTNVGDFLQVVSMVMSNGAVIDDGGWSVSILTSAFQAGDAFNGGLVKKGSGTLYLDTANSYAGPTIVTNGVLAGTGSLNSPVFVGPNGRIGAGDSANPGTFTVVGAVTMQGGALMRISKDGPVNDNLSVSGSIAYGGTLVVSNISVTPLALGDTFTLFSPSSHTGNFSNISGSPGVGLGYSFNPANGQLSVVTSTVATNPTNITVSASSGSMTMTWPGDHLGWTLQSNAVSITSNTDWFDYPPSTGSRDTTNVVIPVTGTTNSVYFRLKYP
jgi:autotransporter-associated beta strand protein